MFNDKVNDMAGRCQDKRLNDLFIFIAEVE